MGRPTDLGQDKNKTLAIKEEDEEAQILSINELNTKEGKILES